MLVSSRASPMRVAILLLNSGRGSGEVARQQARYLASNGHHASISAIATANTARHAGKPYVLFLHGTGIEPRHEGMKEHFGIIYAEALAAGTPPVAYEGGGVSSIITDATGILTQRDPKSLGCAIRELLANPERLEMMARAGRGRAQEKFS